MSKIVRTIIKSAKAPAAVGPYNHGIKVANTIYLSGSLGIDPGSGNMVSGGVEAEARQSLKNISTILEEAGSNLNQVVKTTCLLADMNDFATFNKVYQEFFTSDFPARSTYQVAALPKAARVEIEVIAVTDN